jgi:hypothetical protein
MYRAGIEWILGFRLRGQELLLDPCIPRDWPGFRISFAYHSSRYEIDVENPAGVMRGIQRVEIDGRQAPLRARAGTANPRTLGAAASGSGDGNESGADDPQQAAGEAGREGSGARIPLVDDGQSHAIRVVLG